MLPAEPPPLPALTRAEAELIDRYLDVVDLVGRINPARPGDTYRALRAAQALVARATALRDALAVMHRRGETELHAATLERALRALDGERRSARVALPPPPEVDGSSAVLSRSRPLSTVPAVLSRFSAVSRPFSAVLGRPRPGRRVRRSGDETARTAYRLSV